MQLVRALASLNRRNDYVVLQSRKDRVERSPRQPNFKRSDLWTPCHHRLERYLLSIELAARRLDVLHSPDFIPPMRGAAKHVITVHDLNFLYYPQFLTGDSKRYYLDQIVWAVQRADRIIADSEHTRRDLIVELAVPEDKVTAIHLAADPQFAEISQNADEAAVRRTLGKYQLRRGFVLFVGTLEPRKNIPTLLAAYAGLRAQTTLAPQLVMVGSRGWLYEDIFEAMEQTSFTSDICHLAEVSDLELAHLYLAAGVLALPSHYEGFGLPVLEAMHCLCPVIASNRASLTEVVGNAGLLLEPDDKEAWIDALIRVLSDEALRQRLISAGQIWAQRFSWERTALATREIYEQLA